MISFILSIAFVLCGLFEIIVKANLQLGLSLLIVGGLYEIAFTINSRVAMLTKEIQKLNNGSLELINKNLNVFNNTLDKQEQFLERFIKNKEVN